MSYLPISRCLSFWLLFFVMSCHTLPKQPTDIQRGTLADNGMVSSAHPLASKVGVQILQAGGNATDAAVATFFALAVVYPRAGNIGGGGFAVCRWADGSTNTLDFRETAPNAAHRDMYLD